MEPFYWSNSTVQLVRIRVDFIVRAGRHVHLAQHPRLDPSPRTVRQARTQLPAKRRSEPSWTLEATTRQRILLPFTLLISPRNQQWAKLRAGRPHGRSCRRPHGSHYTVTSSHRAWRQPMATHHVPRPQRPGIRPAPGPAWHGRLLPALVRAGRRAAGPAGAAAGVHRRGRAARHPPAVRVAARLPVQPPPAPGVIVRVNTRACKARN